MLLMMWPVGFLEKIFHTKKASQATLQLDWIRSSQKLEVIVEVKPTAEKNATCLKSKHHFEDHQFSNERERFPSFGWSSEKRVPSAEIN